MQLVVRMHPAIFESRQGLPSIRFGEEALEDPIDPWAGARAFVQPEQLRRGDHVVVFGAGLGYRVQRLVEIGVPSPIVFEPCKEVLPLAAEHGPGLPDAASVFTDPHALHQHLLRVCEPDQNTLLLCAPPYRRAFGESYEALERLVEEVQGLVLLRRNSVAERCTPMTERAIENLARLQHVPPISALGRPLEGVPAFLVAAGPSLDKNRALLHEASKKGVIFAVNTSAPSLAAADIPIDVLVVLEMLDASRPMSKAVGVTRSVALDLTSGGANYEVPVDRKMAFCGDGPAYQALADQLGMNSLGYGGSVATASFALAHRLGADPIVLVGQDLSYPDGRGYASDTLFESTTVHREGRFLVIERSKAWDEMTEAGGLKLPSKVRPCVDITAWGGEQMVPSTHELVCFLRWFEMAARALDGEVRLVNATEGGARVDGFEEMTLSALLEALPEREHGLHEAISAAETLPTQRLRKVARGIEEGSRRLATASKRCASAVRRGSARDLGRAQQRLRKAASAVPLAESHVGPALQAIMADDSIPSDRRERETYRVIQKSAERCAALAKAAEKRLRG